MRKIMAMIVIALLSVAVAACGSETNTPKSQYKQVVAHAKRQSAYIPTHDVELHNYNAAQKVYDTPSTIQWCTFTWANPAAPIVTVPIAGKLTSSSTTFFNPTSIVGDSDSGYVTEGSRSIDGLFHPNPPPYRYGFTPGNQYVDFTDLPTFCTTALTKVQRQKTQVSLTVDQAALNAQKIAEQDLAKGDHKGAQAALAAAVG
jgi:hypothetical protein